MPGRKPPAAADGFAAQQQVAAVGEQVAHQQALQDVAGRRACGRRRYRRTHRRRWRPRRSARRRGPQQAGPAHRAPASHRRPGTGVRPPPPAPSRRGRGSVRLPSLREGVGEGDPQFPMPRFRAAETPAFACRIRRMRGSTKPRHDLARSRRSIHHRPPPAASRDASAPAPTRSRRRSTARHCRQERRRRCARLQRAHRLTNKVLTSRN